MALLMTAALFLARGIEGIANEIAVYAYYSLVIGVILSFLSEVQPRRKGHDI